MMTERDHLSSNRGFTLLELLVVMAIIGILAALLLPVLNEVRCQANEGAASEMINQLESAMIMYKDNQGILPPDMMNGKSKEYVKVLKEPSGRDTVYYNFQESDLHNGRVYSPIGVADKYEIQYQRSKHLADKGLSNNSGRTPENQQGPDLWTADCDDNKEAINNW